MSTLKDIREAMVALIEGTAAGGIRMPTAGLFSVVGDDHLVQQADASESVPRPVYLEAGIGIDDPTLPSDVSGDYRWKARQIPIRVAYAYSPDDTTIERDSTMDDDEDALERVLCEPLNLALTTGWGKCAVTTARDETRDADGVVAIRWVVLIASIAYREDWNT